MPITDLSDDALQHVIQTVGWPAAYRLGRVSRQFLRACQRCPNWVAAERSRLRSHGAHLRGFSLHLRMAISIVTDKTPNPPQFVPWEERPRGIYLHQVQQIQPPQDSWASRGSVDDGKRLDLFEAALDIEWWIVNCDSVQLNGQRI